MEDFQWEVANLLVVMWYHWVELQELCLRQAPGAV